jgi:hypothetical protein
VGIRPLYHRTAPSPGAFFPKGETSMTKKEQAALHYLLKAIEYPVVTAATYVETKEQLVRRQELSNEEVHRRLDSPDYKLGWEQCAIRVKEWLATVGIK